MPQSRFWDQLMTHIRQFHKIYWWQICNKGDHRTLELVEYHWSRHVETNLSVIDQSMLKRFPTPKRKSDERRERPESV